MRNTKIHALLAISISAIVGCNGGESDTAESEEATLINVNCIISKIIVV